MISAVLALIVLAYYFTKISRIILFWIAFVLTRTFGATFGDLLTKPRDHGGMDYGTKGSSLILLGLLVILVIYESIKLKKHTLQKENTNAGNLRAVIR